MLIHVCHSDRHWFVQLFNGLVTLLELALDSSNSELQKLVLSLRLDDLVLKEVLILLESLSTGHPVLDLLVERKLLILDLLTLLVKTINLLIQLVDSLVLQSIVTVFRVQLLDQSLQLLLLRLDVDGVTFEIVVLLFLELVV